MTAVIWSLLDFVVDPEDIASLYGSPSNALDTSLTTMQLYAHVLSTIVIFGALFLQIRCQLVRNLIRNNVAGPDVNFHEAKFEFDPDAGIRRSVEYQRVNGRHGWKAIERVGLGEDGKVEQRRAEQKQRDSIGGLSYKVPGVDT